MEVVNRNVNKSENTINIIQTCLSSGIIVWNKANDKFDFKIKTIIKERSNA